MALKKNNKRMNWNEISELKNDGMDIGSHTMNHEDLKGLSNSEIEYEIGESKQCLLNQGINASTFPRQPKNGKDRTSFSRLSTHLQMRGRKIRRTSDSL